MGHRLLIAGKGFVRIQRQPRRDDARIGQLPAAFEEFHAFQQHHGGGGAQGRIDLGQIDIVAGAMGIVRVGVGGQRYAHQDVQRVALRLDEHLHHRIDGDVVRARGTGRKN